MATRSFCNLLARERGLDPVGYAGVADIFVALELPLPWPYSLWQSLALPEEVRALIALWYGDSSVTRPRLRPMVVAPEAAPEGYRRVMYYARPQGAFADYDAASYLVPEELVGALVWALVMAPEQLGDYARYRMSASGRELWVCTHGAVDAACGKFGYPAYRELKRLAMGMGVTVRRVSHFGGHVFAPTALELPAGRYWAYVDGEVAAQLVRQQGEVGALRGHYRGWAALESGFLQAAEREAWLREGWEWFSYPKRGVTLAQDAASEPRWARVQLEFVRPDGSAGAYEARVELAAPVTTPHSSAARELYPYAQYRVVALSAVSASCDSVAEVVR